MVDYSQIIKNVNSIGGLQKNLSVLKLLIDRSGTSLDDEIAWRKKEEESVHPAPQVTVLGILLAVVFCGCMSTILWWMLHPPAQISLSAAKARVAISAIKKIIVPTTGTSYAERAVELACRLGEKQNAEILVTYVIEIPFTLPLNANMEKAETIAKEAVDRGTGIVQHSNLPFRARVERARNVGEGIIRLAKEEDADLIVMGIRPITGQPEKIIGRTSEAVLRRAPCEVILDRRVE